MRPSAHKKWAKSLIQVKIDGFPSLLVIMSHFDFAQNYFCFLLSI